MKKISAKLSKYLKPKHGIILILAIIILLVIYYLSSDAISELFTGQSYIVSPKDRNILILYTGGTIGMVETKDGNVPTKGFLQKQLKKYLDIQKKTNLVSNYKIKAYDPLLDSSNMSIKNWNQMLTDIRDNYNDYDAFIVVHGTDTLAYTASALSFGLENLGKPVIVTGSQMPLEKVKNDGYDNLLSSLLVASLTDIPEVLVVFDNKIMRGNRSKKKSSNKLNAFVSPNFPNLGNFGYKLTPTIINYLIRDNEQGVFNVQLYNETNEVIIVFLTPGFNYNNVIDLVNANASIKGAIILTFGIGDGPTANKEFLHMLDVLNEHNIVILNISQCFDGYIDTQDYETGKTMTKYKVNSGQDMTIEAGYSKLLYLFSKYSDDNMFYPNEGLIVSNLMKDLRGELSTSGPSTGEMGLL